MSILLDLIMTLLSYIASSFSFIILIVFASAGVGDRTVPNGTRPEPTASTPPPASESAPRRPSSATTRSANSREDEDATTRGDDQSAASTRRRSKYSRTRYYASSRRSDKSTSTPEPEPALAPVIKPVDKPSPPKALFKHLDNPFDRYPPGFVPKAGRLQYTSEVVNKQYSYSRYKPMIDPIRGEEQLRDSLVQLRRALSRESAAAVKNATAIDDHGDIGLETSQDSIYSVIADFSCHRDSSEFAVSTVNAPTVDGPVLERTSGLESTTTADHIAPLVIPQYFPRPVLETIPPLDRSYRPSQKILLAKSMHEPPRITSGMKYLFLDDVDSLSHKLAKMKTADTFQRTNLPRMEGVEDVNTMDYEWETTSTSQTDYEMKDVTSVAHIGGMVIPTETIPEVYVDMAPSSRIIPPMDVLPILQSNVYSVLQAPFPVQQVRIPPPAPLLPLGGAQLHGKYGCGGVTATIVPEVESSALSLLSPFTLPPFTLSPFTLPPSNFGRAPSPRASGNPQPSQPLTKSPEIARASKIPPILRRPQISPLLKPTTHLLPSRKSPGPYVLLEPKFERPSSQAPRFITQIPCINVRSSRPEPTTPTPKGRHRTDKTLLDIYRRQLNPIRI